jgi:hypothetical protein
MMNDADDFYQQARSDLHQRTDRTMAEMTETIEPFEIFDANGQEPEPRRWITKRAE